MAKQDDDAQRMLDVMEEHRQRIADGLSQVYQEVEANDPVEVSHMTRKRMRDAMHAAIPEPEGLPAWLTIALGGEILLAFVTLVHRSIGIDKHIIMGMLFELVASDIEFREKLLNSKPEGRA